MRSEVEILAAIRALPREAQSRIRDAIQKRPRGRPRAVGPTPRFLLKREVEEIFHALPDDMPELEKIKQASKAVPKLGYGPAERVCRNDDSLYRRQKKRWAALK